MKRTNELTRAELQVMNILWDIRKGTVAEVLEQYPEPKPAYNTVLTFLRILKEKGFVTSEPTGKQHRFYPSILRGEYTRNYMRNVKDNLFRGSAKDLVNFFVKEENLTATEIEELIELLKKNS
ncbi:MAG: BlaI/MecI/CopY family transcriptional regulator [Bacteroidaceae bacterium]|nr:BlaI/MecI/CopY family transcriptional regulator [Bacteroidaceae bacterium]